MENKDDFARRVNLSPSFDRRDPRPSVNYGIGEVRMWFYLIGRKGAVQWQIGTGWYCNSAERHLRSFPDDPGGYRDESRYRPRAWDLGYHAREAQYDGQTVVDQDCETIGGPCFYDGSGLNAELLLDGFLEGGERFLWPALEAYYGHVFEGADWPDFAGIRAEVRTEFDRAHDERVSTKLEGAA